MTTCQNCGSVLPDAPLCATCGELAALDKQIDEAKETARASVIVQSIFPVVTTDQKQKRIL